MKFWPIAFPARDFSRRVSASEKIGAPRTSPQAGQRRIALDDLSSRLRGVRPAKGITAGLAALACVSLSIFAKAAAPSLTSELPRIHLVTDSGEPRLSFVSEQAPRVESVNGALNICFIDRTGMLLQINGLPVPEDNGEILQVPSDASLVLMNTPLQPEALTGRGRGDITLFELKLPSEDRTTWRVLSCRGTVRSADGSSVAVEIAAELPEKPENRFLRTNETE